MVSRRDACEASAIDSLWLSDRIAGPHLNLEVLSALSGLIEI